MPRTLVSLAAALALACGDGSTDPTIDSLAGTFTLREMNGKDLPFTYYQGISTFRVLGNTITVTDGATWSEHGTYELTLNGTTSNQANTDQGTWVRHGSTVTFLSGNDLAYTGTFTGSGYILSNGRHNLLYTR